MNNSAPQEHDMYTGSERESCLPHTLLGWCTKGMWGRRGEAVSPIQSSLKPCYKGTKLNYDCTIWICAWAYAAAATHPYPTGASASLLSSLLRPNQARVAWGTPGPWPGGQRLWGVLQAPGRKVTINRTSLEERDPVTTTNINQPTNRKWVVTLIRQH